MRNWIELAESAAEIPVAKGGQRKTDESYRTYLQVTEQYKATGIPQLGPSPI